MNRRVVFLWGPVATLAVLAGALGLLRVYLAEASELLVAELTGAGAQVQRIDVGYLPPSVILHEVRFDTGSERIEAPRVALYPNLSNILHGAVTLDRVELDQPLIRTALSGGRGQGFDPALLPQSLSIRNASFVMDQDGMPSSPLSFSADIEKEAVGLGFAVKSAFLPEFGLTFSGTVDMGSLDPLKVRVNAQKGTFNPSKLLDFFHRFGYLDETALAMFAGTEQIAAEGFRLDFEAATGAVTFAARSLNIDGSSLSECAANVDGGGGWSVSCREGALDAAQIVTLVRAHPDGGKAFAAALHGLGLESLSADGTVGLRDVKVQSRGGAKPAGTLSLASPSLRLSLVSEKGEKQDVTLTNFDGDVTLKNGKQLVSLHRLDLASSVGGTGSLSGELPIPFVWAGTRFQAEARQLDWFGTILDGSLVKKAGRQIDFDVALGGGEILLTAKGLARNEFSGSNRWAAVFDNLEIKTPESEEDGADTEPFDFGFTRDGTLSGKIVVRRLQYNDLPVVRDLSARVTSAKGRTVVKGTGRLCLMKIGVEMVLTPGTLAANLAVTGNGVPLPGVLGCFVDELPVYLRGRLTVQANFFMQGGNGRELQESVRGDVVARLRDMHVLKLSNLDKRLGFFVEIMNAVELEPDKGDTLSFRDGMVFAAVQGQALTLKAVRFSGDKVSVEGKGLFGLGDKRLRLEAHVATPFGVNRDMSIDMRLSEEKSS